MAKKNKGEINHPIRYFQDSDQGNGDRADYVRILENKNSDLKFDGAKKEIEKAISQGLNEITLRTTNEKQEEIVARIQMGLKDKSKGWKTGTGEIDFSNISMNVAHLIKNINNSLEKQITSYVQDYIDGAWKSEKPASYVIKNQEARMKDRRFSKEMKTAINLGYGKAYYSEPKYPDRDIVPQAKIDTSVKPTTVSNPILAKVRKNNYRSTSGSSIDKMKNIKMNDIAVYDFETFGTENEPVQLSVNYKGQNHNLLMKLTEQRTKQMSELIKKAQQSVKDKGVFNGTEQELRDLWNLTDYSLKNGEIVVQHNEAIKNQRITEADISKMINGLNLIGAKSTVSNIYTQNEAMEKFAQIFNHDISKVQFSGTNITGFDNKILDKLIDSYNTNSPKGIVGKISSIDILDVIKEMAPIGTKNAKGEFLLSNKIESIGKWLGLDIKDFAKTQSGKQHGSDFDVGFELSVYKKLINEINKNNRSSGDYSSKTLNKNSYFTSRGSAWRNNARTYKTDSTGELVTGDFSDLLFKNGGLYQFLDYVEKNGQSYANFRDEVSKENIYIAYDDISEIEKIMSKITNGNFSKDRNQIGEKKQNYAVSQLLNSKSGAGILEAYRKQQNGLEISDYYQNIISVLQEVVFKDNQNILEKINEILPNEYEELTQSAKSMVLGEIGSKLGIQLSQRKSDSDVFNEIKRINGSKSVGALKSGFKQYINKHLKAGHFDSKKDVGDLFSALEQINMTDEQLRQGATEFYGVASMINSYFSEEYTSDFDKSFRKLNKKGRYDSEATLKEIEDLKKNRFVEASVKDKIQSFGTVANPLSRTRRLFNNSTEGVKNAISGKHLMNFLDIAGIKDKAINSNLISKDFGNEDKFSFGTAGYYLEQIEEAADRLGIGMQLALDESGNNLRVGFYDQAKLNEVTSVDKNGKRTFNWDRSANYTFGLAKEDGSIRLGTVDKANYLNIYNENHSQYKGARLQTAQEAQFAKILNLFTKEGKGHERLINGLFGPDADLADVSKLLSFEARSILDTAASINPYSSAIDTYDEADSQTTRGNVEQTRSRQLIAHLSHFLQPQLKKKVEGANDFEKSKDYNNKFYQSLQRIYLESQGMGDYVSDRSEYSWMKGDFEKELKKIASLGYDLSPLKEESFLQGMMSISGSSLWDPFSFLIPGYMRGQQQTENRSKKTKSAIKDGNGVLKNFIGSDKGKAFGIDYIGDYGYEQFVTGYINDRDILDAYKIFFEEYSQNSSDDKFKNISSVLKKQANKYVKEKNNNQIENFDEWIKKNIILPSVSEDSRLIRKSTLKDLGDVEKTREDVFSEDEFEKNFSLSLQEGDSATGKNLDSLIKKSKNQLNDYFKGSEIQSIIKKDGKYYVNSTYREKVESGFKGLTADRNTYESIDDVIADIIQNKIFDGYDEKTGEGKIHLFGERDTFSERKAFSPVSGRYRYLINEAIKQKGGNKKAIKEVYDTISGMKETILPQLFSLGKDGDMIVENPNRDIKNLDKDSLEKFVSLEDARDFELALFGNISDKRANRYASRLNPIDEYKWFNPVGSGDEKYIAENSHVKMTHRGTEALNRLINATKATRIGGDINTKLANISAFEEYTKPYFYSPQTEAIERDIKNTQLALEHNTSVNGAQDLSTIQGNAVKISGLSEIANLANALEIDGTNGVVNWENSAMAILKEKALEIVNGKDGKGGIGGDWRDVPIYLDLGETFHLSNTTANGVIQNGDLRTLRIPLFDEDGHSASDSTYKLQNLLRTLHQYYTNDGGLDDSKVIDSIYEYSNSLANSLTGKHGKYYDALNQKQLSNSVALEANGINIEQSEELEGRALMNRETFKGLLRSQDGKSNIETLRTIIKDMYSSAGESANEKELNGLQSEEDLINHIANMITYENNGTKYGFKGFLGRQPYISGLDVKTTLLGISEDIAKDTIRVGIGTMKNINGDNDGDKIQVMSAWLNGTSQEDLKKALKGFDELYEFSQGVDKTVGDMYRREYKDKIGKDYDPKQATENINSENQKNAQQVIEDILNPQDRHIATLLSKLGKKEIGGLSNFSTKMRNMMKNLGVDLNSLQLTNNNKDNSLDNSINSLILSSFSQTFEQDPISSKKVVDRLKTLAKTRGITDLNKVDTFMLDSLENFGNLLKNRDSKGNQLYAHFNDWKNEVVRQTKELGIATNDESSGEGIVSNYATKQSLAVIDSLIKAKASKVGDGSLLNYLSNEGKEYSRFYKKDENGNYKIGYDLSTSDLEKSLDTLEMFSQIGYNKHLYEAMNWEENRENHNHYGASGYFSGLHVNDKHFEQQDVYNGSSQTAQLKNMMSSFEDSGIEAIGVMYVDTLIASNVASGNEAVGAISKLNGIISSFSTIKTPQNNIGGMNSSISSVGTMGMMNGYINDIPTMSLSEMASSVLQKDNTKVEAQGSLPNGVYLEEIDKNGKPVHKYYKKNEEGNPTEELTNVISASSFADTVYGIMANKTYGKTDDLLGKEQIIHDLFYSDGPYRFKYKNQDQEVKFANINNASELFKKTGLSGFKGAVNNEMSIIRGNLTHAILAQLATGGFEGITNTEDLRNKLKSFGSTKEQVEFLTKSLKLKSDSNKNYDVLGDFERYQRGFNTSANLINDTMGNIRSIGASLSAILSGKTDVSTDDLSKGFDFNNVKGIFEDSFQRAYNIGGKSFNAVATIDSLFSNLRMLADYKTGTIYDNKVALQLALEKDVMSSDTNALKLYNQVLTSDDVDKKYKLAKDAKDDAKIAKAREFLNDLVPTVIGTTKSGASIVKELQSVRTEDLHAALAIFANKEKFINKQESNVSSYIPLLRENQAGFLEPNSQGRSRLNQDKWIAIQNIANDAKMTFDQFNEEAKKLGFTVKSLGGADGGTGKYFTIDPEANQKLEFTASFKGGKVSIDEDNWKTSEPTKTDNAVDKQAQLFNDLKHQLGLQKELEAISTKIKNEDLSEDEIHNLNDESILKQDELNAINTRIEDFAANYKDIYETIRGAFYSEANKSEREKIEKEAESNINGTNREQLEESINLLEKRRKLDAEILSLEQQIARGEGTSAVEKRLEQKNKEKEETNKSLKNSIKRLEDSGSINNADYIEKAVSEYDKFYQTEKDKINEDGVLRGSQAREAGKEFIKQQKEMSDLSRKISKTSVEISKAKKGSERYKALKAERDVYYKNLEEYKYNGYQYDSESGMLIKNITDEAGNTQQIRYEMSGKDRRSFSETLNKFYRQDAEKNAKLQTDLTNPGLWQQFKAQFKGTMKYILMGQSAYRIIGMLTSKISQCIQLTKQLDQVITNLMIVTGKSKDQVKDMVKGYSQLADELGATTLEVAQSANEWLRMGYNAEQTKTLITNSLMLSKLGMIETGKATEYLISAMKGYGVAVKDSSKIVDMATSLDMKYAVSSGYILEAMSKSAASAKLAKVEMADLQSMIAIVGETTQKSASSIGESFKTAFARYGNVKAGVFAGDSVKVGGESTEEENMTKEGVNDIEKVLSRVGISLREDDLVTWRSYSDVLKDIGENWARYSDYEKNAITTAMFGTRQRENGLVVLSNYNRVVQASEVALNSAGTAQKKYEAYQNSLEAATKRVSAAWEQLILDLEADGSLKNISELIAGLVKHIRAVIFVAGGLYAAFNLDKLIVGFSKLSYFLNKKTTAIPSLLKGTFDSEGTYAKDIKNAWQNSKSILTTGEFSDTDPRIEAENTNTKALQENTEANRENTRARLGKEQGQDSKTDSVKTVKTETKEFSSTETKTSPQGGEKSTVVTQTNGQNVSNISQATPEEVAEFKSLENKMATGIPLSTSDYSRYEELRSKISSGSTTVQKTENATNPKTDTKSESSEKINAKEPVKKPYSKPVIEQVDENDRYQDWLKDRSGVVHPRESQPIGSTKKSYSKPIIEQTEKIDAETYLAKKRAKKEFGKNQAKEIAQQKAKLAQEKESLIQKQRESGSKEKGTIGKKIQEIDEKMTNIHGQSMVPTSQEIDTQRANANIDLYNKNLKAKRFSIKGFKNPFKKNISRKLPEDNSILSRQVPRLNSDEFVPTTEYSKYLENEKQIEQIDKDIKDTSKSRQDKRKSRKVRSRAENKKANLIKKREAYETKIAEEGRKRAGKEYVEQKKANKKKGELEAKRIAREKAEKEYVETKKNNKIKGKEKAKRIAQRKSKLATIQSQIQQKIESQDLDGLDKLVEQEKKILSNTDEQILLDINSQGEVKKDNINKKSSNQNINSIISHNEKFSSRKISLKDRATATKKRLQSKLSQLKPKSLEEVQSQIQQKIESQDLDGLDKLVKQERRMSSRHYKVINAKKKIKDFKNRKQIREDNRVAKLDERIKQVKDSDLSQEQKDKAIKDLNARKTDAKYDKKMSNQEAREANAQSPGKQAALAAGTMAGTFGGMSLGATIAEKLGGNPAMGSMMGMAIGGAIPSLVSQLAPTIMGGFAGPIAGAVIGGLAIVTSLVKAHNEKMLKLAKEAVAEAEEKLTTANSQETKDKITKYEELVQGVDENGKNVSLSKEDYQEYLDISNDLANIYPSLVVKTDAFGNSLLGLNGVVSSITKSSDNASNNVESLNKELQRVADQKLLNPTYLKDYYKTGLEGIKKTANKGINGNIHGRFDGDNVDWDYLLGEKAQDSRFLMFSLERGTRFNNLTAKQKEDIDKILSKIDKDSYLTFQGDMARGQHGGDYLTGDTIKKLNDAKNESVKKELINYLEAQSSYKNAIKSASNQMIGVVKEVLPAKMRTINESVTEEQQALAMNIAQNFDINSVDKDNIDGYLDSVVNLTNSDNALSKITQENMFTTYEEYQKSITEDYNKFAQNLKDSEGVYDKDFQNLAKARGLTVSKDGKKIIGKDGKKLDDEGIQKFIAESMNFDSNMFNLTDKVIEKFDIFGEGNRDILGQLTASQLQKIYQLSGTKQDVFIEQLKGKDLNYTNILEALNEVSPSTVYEIGASLESAFNKSKISKIKDFDTWVSEAGGDLKQLKEQFKDLHSGVNDNFLDAQINALEDMSKELDISIDKLLKYHDVLRNIDSMGRSNKTMKQTVEENKEIAETIKAIESSGGKFTTDQLEVLKKMDPAILSKIKDDGTLDLNAIKEAYSVKLEVGNLGAAKGELYDDTGFLRTLHEGRKYTDENGKTIDSTEIQGTVDTILDVTDSLSGFDTLVNNAGYDLEQLGNVEIDTEKALTNLLKSGDLKAGVDAYTTILKNQLGFTDQDFDALKKETGHSELTEDDLHNAIINVLYKLLNINFSDLKPFITAQSKIISNSVDDLGLYSDKDKRSERDAYKNYAKAKQAEAKRRRDRAKQLRQYEKDDAKDELTEILERINRKVAEAKTLLEASKAAQALLDSSDFAGKGMALSDQQEYTQSLIAQQESKLSTLVNRVPKSAEEAKEIYSEIESLSSDLMNNEISLKTLNKEIENNKYEAFAKSIEDANNQLERQVKLLDNVGNIIEQDTGLVDEWSLLEADMLTGAFGGYSKDNSSQQKDYNDTLEKQKTLQEQINSAQEKYLELLSEENAENKANDRADAANEARWAVIDYQETLEDFQKNHKSMLEDMGLDWETYKDGTINTYLAIKKELENPIEMKVDIKTNTGVEDPNVDNSVKNQFLGMLGKIPITAADIASGNFLGMLGPLPIFPNLSDTAKIIKEYFKSKLNASGTPLGNAQASRLGIAGENYRPEILIDKATGKIIYIDSPTAIDLSTTDVVGEKQTANLAKFDKGTVSGQETFLPFENPQNETFLGHLQTRVEETKANGKKLVDTEKETQDEMNETVFKSMQDRLEEIKSEYEDERKETKSNFDKTSIIVTEGMDDVSDIVKKHPIQPEVDFSNIENAFQTMASLSWDMPWLSGSNPSSLTTGTGNSIVNEAAKYRGTPYTWGGGHGSDMSTLDCSGYVSAVLRSLGYINTSYTADGFKNVGVKISPKDMQPGDLLIFDYKHDGHADHIGIYAGDGKMWHSSGGKKNDKSNPGKGVTLVNYSSYFQKALTQVNRVMASGTPLGNTQSSHLGIAGENYRPEVLIDKTTGKATYIDSPTVIDLSTTDVVGEKQTAKLQKFSDGTTTESTENQKDVSEENNLEDNNSVLKSMWGAVQDTGNLLQDILSEVSRVNKYMYLDQKQAQERILLEKYGGVDIASLLTAEGRNSDNILEDDKLLRQLAFLKIDEEKTIIPADLAENFVSSLEDQFKNIFTDENLQKEFSEWLKGISEEEKNLLYAINKSEDTTSWNLSDWQNSLSAVKENEDNFVASFIQKRKDEWDENYNKLTSSYDNPYYLSYLAQDYKDMAKQSQQKNIDQIMWIKENRSEYYKQNKRNAKTSDEYNAARAEEQNDLLIYERNLKISNLNLAQQRMEDIGALYHYQMANPEKFSEETINKTKEAYLAAIEEIKTLNEDISNLSEKMKQNTEAVLRGIEATNEFEDQMRQDAYDLGQTNNFKALQEYLRINDKENIKSYKEKITERENLLRIEGQQAGKSEAEIERDILGDETLRTWKKTLNSYIKEAKAARKAILDDTINDLNRSLSKLELRRPQKWIKRTQIADYYQNVKQNAQASIKALTNYLETAENLSVEEMEEIYDQINEKKKAILSANIDDYSDRIAHQEEVYSALQAQVDLYIDNLNEEKELIDERYDDEIKKLQQVNEDKERSIKLTQLQQNLENAQNQKKRVYRAGVGFVYEADRNEIRTARQELESFYRQDKIDDLTKAKEIEDKFYEDRIQGWNKYLKAIEKIYKAEERAQNQRLLMQELNVKSLEELNKKLIEDRDKYVLDFANAKDMGTTTNYAYSGAWDSFLEEYNSNVKTLRDFEESELSLVKERLKLYYDSDLQTASSINSKPINFTGRIFNTRDGYNPEDLKAGDLVITEGGIYEVTAEGAGQFNPNDAKISLRLDEDEERLGKVFTQNKSKKIKDEYGFAAELKRIYNQEKDIETKKLEAESALRRILQGKTSEEQQELQNIYNAFYDTFSDGNKSIEQNFGEFLNILGGINPVIAEIFAQINSTLVTYGIISGKNLNTFQTNQENYKDEGYEERKNVGIDLLKDLQGVIGSNSSSSEIATRIDNIIKEYKREYANDVKTLGTINEVYRVFKKVVTDPTREFGYYYDDLIQEFKDSNNRIFAEDVQKAFQSSFNNMNTTMKNIESKIQDPEINVNVFTNNSGNSSGSSSGSSSKNYNTLSDNQKKLVDYVANNNMEINGTVTATINGEKTTVTDPYSYKKTKYEINDPTLPAGYGGHKLGTNSTSTSSFIAGEKGPEIGIYPDGTAVLYGANGPALYQNQPLGTTIFPADQSEKALSLYSDGTVNWDAYNSPQVLAKNNSYYPNYTMDIPKVEVKENKTGDTIYNIEKVDLPNVTDPSEFWKGLQSGVKRHMKDK